MKDPNQRKAKMPKVNPKPENVEMPIPKAPPKRNRGMEPKVDQPVKRPLNEAIYPTPKVPK